MITISYWALAAICLGLGAAAYGLGRWSAELRAERLRDLMGDDFRQEFPWEE